MPTDTLISDSHPVTPEPGQPEKRRLLWAGILYLVLLAVFYLIARLFALKPLREHPVSLFTSFALIFAPWWFFGFGAAKAVRGWLKFPLSRHLAPALLVVPYMILAVPRGEFRWGVALAIGALAVAAAALLHYFPGVGNWADFLVLAGLGIIIDLGLLGPAWPFGSRSTIWPPGLGGFPKLMLTDLALYCYLVVKPVEGIGYDLVPNTSDFKFGFREFLFYAPIVIPAGLLLGFLHFHPILPNPLMAVASWIFTFVFVAMPEELFFRGLLQNILERRLGRRGALLAASLLFGLSHFNKRAAFNWRYILLATIAGIFYGRAWLARRRLFASSVTHASVDTVWSLWFR
ncbi:MAG TPA: CPBP family intramembrane glutamic endopeptidase [Candidatus Angelobacter sp.]|nr:CPBP family intramembrane glutamic endopeptidase [Candidatus Angelobacter sp.]